MVDPRASRFWQVALQSGLIDGKGLQACFEAIVPEKRVAEQLDRRLARQAVQQGRLTIWQAQQIMAGRSTGYKINRYVLIDMIGQGGMGRVYLARDTRLNRRVALKILSPERMNNPRAIARFQREARVGAQLQHENLVRIYDEGEANGKCYLVMEYIEGKNLGAIIAEDGQIPPAGAAHITRQVALGLEHAQKKGLIHRDVNPYNILITRDGVAKLTDLGLAIDQSEEAQVTREGATVGTFDYISPEQARHSHSVDTRSDIYSLGCTLYHMLAGHVPFPSPSLPEKLFAHQGIEPPALTGLVPGIPEGLAAVVQKMMRKAPDDRYATPLDVAVALEPFIAEGPGAPPSTGTAAVPESRGLSRSSMTETQVVATPAAAPRPEMAATVEAGSATEAPSASSSIPGIPSPVAANPVSRSDEDWAGLGLAIDLGPEPSLTEGLAHSRKKKPKSSTELGPDAPTTPDASPGTEGTVAGPTGPPPAAPAGPGPGPAAAVDGLGGLGLDLGPDAPLSAGARTASKSATAAGSASAAPAPWRRFGQRWVIAAGALVGVAILAGLGFGFGLLGQGKSRGTTQGTSRPILAAQPESKPAPDDGEPTSNPKAKGDVEVPAPAGRSFAVKLPDGKIVAEPSLKGAMQRAIGSKGHVLLSNREPIRLTGTDAAINISGGPLYIRGAEGVRPVLEVELKGPKPAPFLTTRTNTPLTIIGVSIVARYHGKPKVVPAVIEAGGSVRFERCAFTASGDVKGTRAIAAEGGGLTVSSCWFEGFDRAIDAASFAGSTLTVRQSMMVRAANDDQLAGWAVRVRRTPGGTAEGVRKLVMEHCTAKGKGLLELVDFSPRAPLRVDLNECAVLADAMLAWMPGKSETDTPLSPDALDWKGQGNLYDIRGKAWVVLSPEGTPELPDGPTDLASWRSNMRELSAFPPPIRFQTAPESLSESPTPRDFKVIGLDAQPPGADPARVGPGAPPEKH